MKLMLTALTALVISSAAMAEETGKFTMTPDAIAKLVAGVSVGAANPPSTHNPAVAPLSTKPVAAAPSESVEERFARMVDACMIRGENR